MATPRLRASTLLATAIALVAWPTVELALAIAPLLTPATLAQAQTKGTAQLLYTLSGHTEAVNTVAFTPFNKLAITGSTDKTVRVWDLSTGQSVQTLNNSYAVNSMTLSPDGNTIYGTGPSFAPKVKFWQRETGRLVRVISGFEAVVRSIDVSPDNLILATGILNSEIRLWDTRTGNLIRTLKDHTDHVTSVAFSPDGRFLVSGAAGRDRTIKVWEVATGRLLRTITGHKDWVLSVAVMPNGRYIVSGSADKTIKMWELETGDLVRTFTGHTNWVRSVAVSRNNNLIVSGSKDGTVKVWDKDTGRMLYDIKAVTKAIDEVQSVTFASDNKTIMAGSTDDFARIWRLN